MTTSKILPTEKHTKAAIELANAWADGKEREGQRMAAAHAAMKTCVQIAQELDAIIPNVAEFAKERDRLGEYDASAAAIIELAKIALRMAEYNRSMLQAQIDFMLMEK